MSRTTEHLMLTELEKTYTIVEIQQHIYRAATYGSSGQIGCMYAMRTFYQEVLKYLKECYHSFIESLKSKMRKMYNDVASSDSHRI